MNPLSVRFTLKGKNSETDFGLYFDKNGHPFLRGLSPKGDELLYPLCIDNNNIFHLETQENIFEESLEVIESRLVGLSEVQLESISQGLEEEYSPKDDTPKPGYGPDDIYFENKAFSISQIIELINDGDIELSPHFQRHFVWDSTRQSQLIESIILGLPLPSIYLSQYPYGRLTIVDGLQRIHTIKRFIEDELTLCNMEYLEICDGKTYSQLKDVLPLRQWRRFKQTQILCFVIDYRSPSNLKYDLFRRLNTGGKPLNPQEIRNCLSRPHLQQTLYSMASSKEFIQATGNSVKDTRMEAQELSLRFIYFYSQYTEDNPIGKYSGNLDSTLNEFVDTLNSKSPEYLNQFVELFAKSMALSYKVFGKYAFRKVMKYYPIGRKPQVNKQLLLTISVLMAKFGDLYAKKIDELNTDMTQQLASLIDNDEDTTFFNAISWSTNTKTNIKYTFDTMKHNLFDKYLLDHENS